MKYEYRPLIIKHLHDNIFELFNTNGFINADKYLVKFKINNEIIDMRFSLKSLEKTNFELPIDITKENIIYVNVYLWHIFICLWH